MGKSIKKWFAAPYEFLLHALVGIFIFLVIAAAAIGLDFLVQWLEAKAFSGLIILGLKGAEYTLFGADLALFLVFIVRTVIDSTRKIWSGEDVDEP